jgi:hypothetical protein
MAVSEYIFFLNQYSQTDSLSSVTQVLLTSKSDTVMPASESKQYLSSAQLVCNKKWTRWGLNPGPSACEADVIPLHHEPLEIYLHNFNAISQGMCPNEYFLQTISGAVGVVVSHPLSMREAQGSIP